MCIFVFKSITIFYDSLTYLLMKNIVLSNLYHAYIQGFLIEYELKSLQTLNTLTDYTECLLPY